MEPSQAEGPGLEFFCAPMAASSALSNLLGESTEFFVFKILRSCDKKNNGWSQLRSLRKGPAHPERAPCLLSPHTYLHFVLLLGAGHPHAQVEVKGTGSGDQTQVRRLAERGVIEPSCQTTHSLDFATGRVQGSPLQLAPWPQLLLGGWVWPLVRARFLDRGTENRVVACLFLPLCWLCCSGPLHGSTERHIPTGGESHCP